MPKSILLVVAAVFAHAMFAGQSCESLVSLKLARAVVNSATVSDGPVDDPARPNVPAIPAPRRCVVKGVARPTLDSEIKFEVWMPVSGWNGKYRQSGNGGWAGSIPGQALAHAVRLGYATAATDDGHEGGTSASWAVGHPEKLIDFGHRAVHQTSVQAKAIVRAFYGTDPARNYFVGCSDGGREALMEAERYPEDFDGIIAGAPANYWSHHFTGFVWNEQALLEEPGNAIPPEKLKAIQDASLAACDALDGVKDGLVEDPRICHFDPGVLACKGADSPSCLTPPQVEALRKIYAGPKNPRTGEQIFPGYAPGTENGPSGWNPWITPPKPDEAIQFRFGNTYYGQAVFEDPNWDFRKFNFDSDVTFGDEKAGSVLNSYNPDLRSFRAHGGKLLQYHGWGDAAIAPMISIQYYEAVKAFLARFPDARSDGRRPIEDFYRLYMVPGMGHCRGGVGPNEFGNGNSTSSDPTQNIVAALELWVEKGTAPGTLIGTGQSLTDPGKTLTRPLCPYPQVARYKGSGDPNQASSFFCAVPAASR